ncbi:molybdenum cofactor guanylyltransferase [Syntrophomonas erecta]
MRASGVILAGGKSSRMKFNKAFAPIGSSTAIEIIIEKFQALFAEILIVSNDPEEYEHLGLKVVTDVYPRRGPVAGIHAGLHHALYSKIFILACDMPFINPSLIRYMLGQLGTHECAIPKIDGCLQPTAAVYSKKALPSFTRSLEEDKLKLILLIEELDLVLIEKEQIQQFGSIQELFFNVNDPDALLDAQKMAGRLL